MRGLCMSDPFRNRLPVFGIATALFVLAMGVWASPAFAVPGCDDEETMFPPDHRVVNGQTVQGNQGLIRVSTHDLANCSGQYSAEFHATVHVQNTNHMKFAEAGYVQDNNGNFRVFEEGDDGSAPPGQPAFGSFGLGHAIDDPGSTPYFAKIWLNTVNQTTTWKFWIDEHDNGNQVLVSSSSPTFDANFTLAYDYGEVGRRGGAGTGASDVHKALKALVCSGSCTWNSWTDNDNGSGICNWSYHHVSTTSFETTKNGSSC